MSGSLRQAWGPDQDDRLRDLFLVSGRPVGDIAAMTGRSLSSVRTRLSRLGMCGGPAGNPGSDRAAEAAERRRSDAAKSYVRCLGVGSLEHEHRFVSPDPSRIRVCPTCRRRVEGID